MGLNWPWSKTKRARDTLVAYPAFDPPHPGKGSALSRQDRERNLAWFLTARAGRSAVLRGTMTQLGYPLQPTMPSPEAVEAASLVFHRLCHDHLIGWKLAIEGLDSRRALDPAAAGIEGFGRDIGMFLGDAAVAIRPALTWVLDHDIGLSTYGEVVIGLDPGAPTELSPVTVDALATGAFQLRAVADTGRTFKRPNAFSFAVDVAQGRYELPANPR
jgi:hypothetical protein